MKKILVCNQKMFLTHDEAQELRNEIDLIDTSDVNMIMCPSFLNFDVFNGYNLSSQDCFYEDRGAYTGEISAYALSLMNIKYSLVGHSERRKLDTNEIINKKIKSLLRNMMTPILCIGETSIEKDMMRTSEVIKKQLEVALKDITLDSNQNIIVAYEPRWAIGSGNHMNKADIIDTLKYIKKVLKQLNIDNYYLLYGGSVDSKDINDVLTDETDGYLIGNASVSANELSKIINSLK